MLVAALAFTLFLVAFLLHWVLWRVKIPRRQTLALLVILLSMPPLGLGAVCCVPVLRFLGPLGIWELLHVSIFHVAVSLAYIVAYTAIEGRSPSMALLIDVADARGRGRSRADLEQLLRGDDPVAARLQAMLLDGMVERADGSYRLSAKGWVWARALGSFRRLLGMEKGG